MLKRILIVEDDPAKKNRLLAFLESKKGLLFEKVETALSVNCALRLLREEQYDLLVVDVVLPATLGGVPNESNSIELLTQIDEGIDIKQPRYSVAISAYDQLDANSKEFFSARPWGILPYSDSNDECLSTINKICQYILNQDKKQSSPKRCDIFILTALMEPEFNALEFSEINWSPLEPLDEVQLIKYGQISLGGSEKIVSAAFATRMGAVSAAILASKVILMLKPKLIIMVGICAGLPAKTSIGDVIAAEISWDWQSGKYIDKEGEEAFEISPHQISIEDKVRRQLILLKRDQTFWGSLVYLSNSKGQSIPKLVLGPMATGSSVLADARVVERIKNTQHRNLSGLDMEVYGVYAAACLCDPNIHFLALKSVCDQGDIKKDDYFQSYASEIAARTVFHFIEKYSEPLLK